jgi:hypothetical protein
MTGPGIPAQLLDVLNQTRPRKVQMNISDRFPEINIFLTTNRFKAIMKQMALPSMATVEIDNIAGKYFAHAGGQRETKKYALFGFEFSNVLPKLPVHIFPYRQAER